MGLGISFSLVAAGAVLASAVSASVGGFDLAAAGWILMIVGGVFALLSAMSLPPARRVVHRDDERIVRRR